MFYNLKKYLGIQHNAVIYLILVMLLAIVAVAFMTVFLNPENNPFALKCFLYTQTGIQCPLCGGQRSLFYLLQGDLAKSWHFNPLLILTLPIISLFLFNRYIFKVYIKSEILWYGLLVGIILFFIFRNIF